MRMSTATMRLNSLLLLLLLGLLFFGPLSVLAVRIELEHLPESCGFHKCHPTDPNKLNVHLVPHTHDDVGWLKTVDQYYYGSQQHYQKAGVQYIIDSVVQALIRNKERRFIYVEVAFFSRWWDEQDEPTKAIVRELVNSGQLEFVNGGFCMNDEACTHYSSIIDQMTLGLKFLNDTFGQCGLPRAAWQIDPFGHSKEQASIFAQMNFDGMFFSRIDYQDQDFRREQRTLEHVWHGSEDLGADSDIFASVINHGYAPPDKFNWDLLDGRDEPIIDNVASEEYNLDQRVEQFVEAAILYQSNYRTNHIMFPMGEDFEYQAAHVWFKNMDKLIAGVNAKHSRVNVLYSTPSCYLKALNESGTLFTDKSDDFLPYSSNVDSVWSGYFTSRPTLKRLDKVANNWLQACKQIDVLAGNPHNRYAKQIGKLKESVAVFQHHDAVVGTEKQHVANDYVKQLQAGIDQCREVISASLGKLISGSNSAPKYMYCDYLNISSCSATEKNNHLGLQLYNPFSHRVVNHTVRIPVDYTLGQYVEVTDARGGRVPATIFAIPEWIRKVPGREGNASEEVVFDVSIEPLSYNTYFVKYVSQPNDNVAVVAARWDINQNITVSIGKRQFTFDSDGRLTTTSIDAKSVIHFEHDFYYYEGATGDNKLFHRSSGAYVFKPKASAPKLVGKLIETSLYVDDDRNLYEIHQKYDTFVAQVIRLHPHKEFIEFNWFVDSIPISDNVGKEVIVRYRATNMNTHSTFTTDSNGRQMIERVWNYRPSWNYTSYQLMPGNYYPANSRVYVQDKAANVQFTVMTDRTQGCTSPGNGSIELMLHRRLLHDDSFGVGEALNETGPNGEGLKVTGTHYLLFDSIKDSTRKHRTFGQQLYLFPLISFVPINSNAERQRLLKFAAQTTLAAALPENVNILTLEQWDERQILLRLEHFYQSNEDVELSKPAKVDLTRLFANIKINTARELTLGANQDIAARGDRLSFRYKSSNSLPKATAEGVLDPKEVTLNPMQIRTFLVSY